MASFDDILIELNTLDEALLTQPNESERKNLIGKHIEKLSNSSCFIVPEFSKDLEWLNVKEPLVLSKQLNGKVTVLDFFTYCCVNCMHVLPDLHELENKFSIEEGLVVVGVHSAKFLNEKVTANILSAVLRHDITHPVVNDSECSLWQKLQVMCWPTFVIVGPKGQYLYSVVGEGHKQQLFEFVEVAVDYFKSCGQIQSHPLPIELEKSKLPPTPLQFPGKIGFTQENQLLISDTGNHRILITDVNGIVESIIGNGTRGFVDGDFNTAKFFSPQGCAVKGDQIYVTDTENHAIRKIDMKSKMVSTVVGTGVQGNDKEGGKVGIHQEISSPWDVVLGKSPGGHEDDVLFIAMAGTHQIWCYFLQAVTWYKGMKYDAGVCVRFAGSGAEENRNNSYPQKAGFAQPSGLAISRHGDVQNLYVADSESSTVRCISLKDGSVKNLVGGERDPNNLFAYGDVDGKGIEAKLQHPLGVALLEEKQQLFISDSYNHKIKRVDLTTKVCTTIFGGSDTNEQEKLSINEPGGLVIDESKGMVYIADTNNCEIKVLDLETSQLTRFPILISDDTDLSVQSAVEVDSTLVQPLISLANNSQVNLCVNITLVGKEKLNEEAPQSWTLLNQDKVKCFKIIGGTKGKLRKDKVFSSVSIDGDNGVKDSLDVMFQLVTCDDDNNTCSMKRVLVRQPIHITDDTNTPTTIDFNIKL